MGEENQILNLYRDWLRIEEDIKEQRTTQNDFLTNYAKSRGVQKSDLVKAFRAQRRKEAKDEDEAAIISDLMSELQ